MDIALLYVIDYAYSTLSLAPIPQDSLQTNCLLCFGFPMDTVGYNEYMHKIDMKYQLDALMHAVMACQGSNVLVRLIVMLLQMIMGHAFNLYTYF